MDNQFNELPWHDAELLCVTVDRQNPGDEDQVVIDVCWPNGEKNRITFIDCYGFYANMNFGIMASESILEASFVEQSQELEQIREKWRKLGVDLGRLGCFEIKTNSTSSNLCIYALQYSLQ